nr:hypothetical protein [Mediterraneibacter glycyrrhizinilyticus]
MKRMTAVLLLVLSLGITGCSAGTDGSGNGVETAQTEQEEGQAGSGTEDAGPETEEGEGVACEDLAAAITFIFEHADELGVSTDCYSLWGGSAGVRMAAYLGSYGPEAYGGEDLPRPGAVIMQYTGHTDYTENDPPTYACVGENDGIANWHTMEQRIENLEADGIETEFHHYPDLQHGFGLGIGTSAEGWIDDAVDFWQEQIDK